MEKCHIQLLRCNELGKLASGLPDHDVAVLAESGKPVGARRFSHSPQGLHDWKPFWWSLASHPEELAGIGETNHGLRIAFLLSAGIPLYPVTPNTINGLRKVAGAKTDRLDAQLWAKAGYFRLCDLHRWEPDSPTIQALKTLPRDQDALVQMQTRLVNHLTACLKEYDPVALQLFSQVPQPATVRFLQAYPTPEAAGGASVEEITATLRHGKFPNFTQAAAAIVAEGHRPQLEASTITVRTNSRLRLSLVKHLLVVLESLASHEKEMQARFLTHPDHERWSSLPRAGKRLAPRRLSEGGDDRTRSGDAQSVQELAGTAPVPFQSGTSARAPTRFACVNPWRNDRDQFAWQSTLSEPWAASY
jgi:transposase